MWTCDTYPLRSTEPGAALRVQGVNHTIARAHAHQQIHVHRLFWGTRNTCGQNCHFGGTRLDVSGNAVGNGLIWARNVPELFAQHEAHTGARGLLRFGVIPLQAAWPLLYSLVLTAALGQQYKLGGDALRQCMDVLWVLHETGF